MRVQQRYRPQTKIALIGFLLAIAIGLIPTENSLAQLDDDLLEALQISPFSERVEAPDFSLKSIDGSQKTLADYKGKVVFLNFWTTW